MNMLIDLLTKCKHKNTFSRDTAYAIPGISSGYLAAIPCDRDKIVPVTEIVCKRCKKILKRTKRI